MRLADRPPQPILRLRHRNQVNMIGHEAVRPDLDPPFSAPLAHQFKIRRIIFGVKKRLLPAISPLCYVMRQTRND
jgi:hypothetical protein